MARLSLRHQVDTELSTAFLRVMVFMPVAVIIWSDQFLFKHGHIERAFLLRPLVLAVLVIAVALLISILIYPKSNKLRALSGIVLDATAIAGALFLGESALAPAAAFYLWMMVGNGFVFGVRYLYIATGISLLSFGSVYLASEYWQNNPTFSLTIATGILLITPYLGSLLSSLHQAKRTISWQANFDVLTRVLNRRAFKNELRAVMHNSKQSKSQHLLLFCDLDEFKIVNDTAGHAAGDKVLHDIAKIFRDNITQADRIGRIGGDEFCIILKNRSWNEGRACAENIRNAVASYRLAWGTKYYSVSVSIGIAPNTAVTDEDSLIRLSDAACYAAKKAGRNQIHIVDPRFDPVDTQRIRNLQVVPSSSRS